MIVLGSNIAEVESDLQTFKMIGECVVNVLRKIALEGGQQGIKQEDFESFKVASIPFVEGFLGPLIKAQEDYLALHGATKVTPPAAAVVAPTPPAPPEQSVQDILKAAAKTQTGQPTGSRADIKSNPRQFFPKYTLSNQDRLAITIEWSKDPVMTDSRIEELLAGSLSGRNLTVAAVQSWVSYLSKIKANKPSEIESGWNYIKSKYGIDLPIPSHLLQAKGI